MTHIGLSMDQTHSTCMTISVSSLNEPLLQFYEKKQQNSKVQLQGVQYESVALLHQHNSRNNSY